jgi:hypothetical protein
MDRQDVGGVGETEGGTLGRGISGVYWKQGFGRAIAVLARGLYEAARGEERVYSIENFDRRWWLL